MADLKIPDSLQLLVTALVIEAIYDGQSNPAAIALELRQLMRAVGRQPAYADLKGLCLQLAGDTNFLTRLAEGSIKTLKSK
jgi:hypothetical protein